MNYTIPKTRQQALEIYNSLQVSDSDPKTTESKYEMFIGALTACSDEEFKYCSSFSIGCFICKIVGSTCKSDISCREQRNKIFSKHWNE